MNEEQMRIPVSTDEFNDARVEDELVDIEGAIEGEEIDWMELERVNMHDEAESHPAAFLRSEDINQLRSHWNAIQTRFVDEPRACVEQADVLVAEVMEQIVGLFSEKSAELNELWANHEDASTEDLRIALQRYRSFFNYLLEF